MAAELALTAFRHAPYGGVSGLADIVRLGDDWETASFSMAIATEPGGTALITLTNQAEGSQGISADYDNTMVHPITGAVVGGTTIRPQIDETALEGLTYSGSADLELYYTLYVTPAGQPKRVLLYGSFTVKQGVE